MKNNSRLTKLLEQQLQESDSTQFEVHEQIERNYRYYGLEPLGNEQAGRSQYVSPEVHDTVESMKALFKETFLSNRQTVKFTSNGSVPEEEAQAKTAYVGKVLRRNKQERLFSHFWHDAFLAKRGVVLAEWAEDTSKRTITVQRQPEQMVMMQASFGGNVVDVDTSRAQQQYGPDGTIYLSGEVDVIEDDSAIRLTLCAPEKYYRDPESDCVEDAMWASYENDVPRGTLIRDGYDEEQIDGLKLDYRWRTDEVDFSRRAHDQGHTRHQGMNRTSDQESVTVYKTWTWLNMSEHADDFDTEFPDEIKLYEVHWACGEVLMWANGSYAIREAQEMPFFEWSELPIPHADIGMASADVVAHSQKSISALKRSIIDYANITNNPRMEAVLDNIRNPRDLIDNVIGGVIDSDVIGSVAPLITPQMSPSVFGTLQMMQQDTESRSGMSSLAKGMNTDALRAQNAADMVERLTNAAKTRPMAAARDWANTFLIPLCQYIVRMGMENDTSQEQIEQGGRMIVVAPQQWKDEGLDMTVAVALTPQEGEAHAQQLMVMHQVMMSDPQLSTLYGIKQRHALIDDVFDAMGVSDTTRYMIRPDGPEFVQVQQGMAQQKQMEMQQMQRQQAMQEAMMKFQMQSDDDNRTRQWADLNNKIMDTLEDNEREDRKQSHQETVDERELDIEESQKRQVGIG